MLTIIQGDITKVKINAECIVNSSNGLGIMPRGVAFAIKEAGGWSIELQAIKECLFGNSKSGDLFVTNSGSLPFKQIIHLVTMKFPFTKTKIQTIKTCLINLVSHCKENHIHKVALPSLGAGWSHLDKSTVSQLYKEILEPISDIEFIVVDTNEEFIHSFFK